MRALPSNREAWFRLLLFPFKIYLPLGLICFLVWEVATVGHRPRGALAQAILPVVVGYLICTGVFLAAAVPQFVTRRWKAAAKTLLFAAIAFGLVLLLLPLCATS